MSVRTKGRQLRQMWNILLGKRVQEAPQQDAKKYHHDRGRSLNRARQDGDPPCRGQSGQHLVMRRQRHIFSANRRESVKTFHFPKGTQTPVNSARSSGPEAKPICQARSETPGLIKRQFAPKGQPNLSPPHTRGEVNKKAALRKVALLFATSTSAMAGAATKNKYLRAIFWCAVCVPRV